MAFTLHLTQHRALWYKWLSKIDWVQNNRELYTYIKR